MGLITGKIASIALAGVVTVGSVAGFVAFDGQKSLDYATDKLYDQASELVQFELNEGSLLEKIEKLREMANGKVAEANELISDKNTNIGDKAVKIAQLEEDLAKLQTKYKELEITQAKTNELWKNEQNAHNMTKAQLAEANSIITELKDVIYNLETKVASLTAENKALQAENAGLKADKATLEETNEALIGEVIEANKAADAVADAADQAAERSEGAEPLTKEELEAINVEVDPIIDGGTTEAVPGK